MEDYVNAILKKAAGYAGGSVSLVRYGIKRNSLLTRYAVCYVLNKRNVGQDYIAGFIDVKQGTVNNHIKSATKLIEAGDNEFIAIVNALNEVEL